MLPEILVNLPESSGWLPGLPQILTDLPDCSGGFQENLTHVVSPPFLPSFKGLILKQMLQIYSSCMHSHYGTFDPSASAASVKQTQHPTRGDDVYHVPPGLFWTRLVSTASI